MKSKFKVGDEVVWKNSPMGGRPRVRTITKIEKAEDKWSYQGEYWKTSEDNLILANEFDWPEESEMKFMDRKQNADMDRLFKEIMDHGKEDYKE